MAFERLGPRSPCLTMGVGGAGASTGVGSAVTDAAGTGAAGGSEAAVLRLAAGVASKAGCSGDSTEAAAASACC